MEILHQYSECAFKTRKGDWFQWRGLKTITQRQKWAELWGWRWSLFLLSVTRTVAPCSKGMREVWYLHPKQWRHFEWDQVFFLSFSRALQGGLDNAGWHPITCCCKMRVTEQQGKDGHACTTHQEPWGLSIWNSSKGWLMQCSESLNTKSKKPGSLAIWRNRLLFCCINDRGKWCIITIFVL